MENNISISTPSSTGRATVANLSLTSQPIVDDLGQYIPALAGRALTLGDVLALLGFVGITAVIATILFAKRQMVELFLKITQRKISWGRIERGIAKMRDELTEDGFRPDHIICIGRNGVILGAMLSANFDERGNSQGIPVSLLNASHSKVGPTKETKFENFDVVTQLLNSATPQNLLVLFSECVTGDAAKAFHRELEKKLSPETEKNKVKFASFFCNGVRKDGKFCSEAGFFFDYFAFPKKEHAYFPWKKQLNFLDKFLPREARK